MVKYSGGPAFPCEQGETQDGRWNDTFEPGMSLRDYFAAKALSSLQVESLNWSRTDVLALSGVSEPTDLTADQLWDRAIAKRAYGLADAMIEARSL